MRAGHSGRGGCRGGVVVRVGQWRRVMGEVRRQRGTNGGREGCGGATDQEKGQRTRLRGGESAGRGADESKRVKIGLGKIL